LSDGLGDVGTADGLAEPLSGDQRDLADRCLAVAMVEYDRGERLEAVRLLGCPVIDHRLVTDGLDQ
jgi:hypothetical protein